MRVSIVSPLAVRTPRTRPFSMTIADAAVDVRRSPPNEANERANDAASIPLPPRGRPTAAT